jgi:hypothetical protein
MSRFLTEDEHFEKLSNFKGFLAYSDSNPTEADVKIKRSAIIYCFFRGLFISLEKNSSSV